MTALNTDEATGGNPATPAPSAVAQFITITNTTVLMLSQLADEIREAEPGTAEAIEAYSYAVAGSALELVQRWPL